MVLCSQLLWIQSSSNLQVTRTGIKSLTSLNYSLIWSNILELRALKWWKNDVHFQSYILQNCMKLEQDKISIEFKFQLDRTAGFAVKCPWVSKQFLIGRFCYAETGFVFSSSSFNSSTKGRLEFQMKFIPWANCSSGERLLPSWATCFYKSILISFCKLHVKYIVYHSLS